MQSRALSYAGKLVHRGFWHTVCHVRVSVSPPGTGVGGVHFLKEFYCTSSIMTFLWQYCENARGCLLQYHL